MSNLLRQPRLEVWMDTKEIDFRLKADEYLLVAQELGIIPKFTKNNRSFFQEGESSVVIKIKTSEGILVIKLSSRNNLEGEAFFLNKWRTCGIRTPQVFNLHTADSNLNISLLVLEYIDAPLLSEVFTKDQMIDKGIFRQLGKILSQIHQIKGSGYGQPQENHLNQGIHTTFTADIAHTFNLKNQYFDLQQSVIQIMEADCVKRSAPSLVHYDFRPYNMFSTSPITVFDPIPRITHPYMCLALPLLKSLVQDPDDNRENSQFIAGYEEVELVNINVLSAAIILRGLSMLEHWRKKGKTKNIDNLEKIIKKYLEQL